jgi:hypothetical protein
MAKTGSIRRSRSKAADAIPNVSGKRRSGSRGDALERTRDPGTPGEGDKTPPTQLGAQKPGAVRIVSCLSGKSNESSDLADLPKLIAAPDHKIWVDLASPDEKQVKAAADALGLHPLIAEDIRERNQRSKIESFDPVSDKHLTLPTKA